MHALSIVIGLTHLAWLVGTGDDRASGSRACHIKIRVKEAGKVIDLCATLITVSTDPLTVPMKLGITRYFNVPLIEVSLGLRVSEPNHRASPSS